MRAPVHVAALAATLVGARVAHAQTTTLLVRTGEPARVAALVGGEPVAAPVLCVHRCTLAVPAGRATLSVQGPRGGFTSRVFTVPPEGAVTRLRLGTRREGIAAGWLIASAATLLASVPLIGLGSACLGTECSSWWAVTAGWSGLVLFTASFPLLAVGIAEAARLGDGLDYVLPARVETPGARAMFGPVTVRF